MKLMLYLGVWYAIAFGVMLMQAAWNLWKSSAYKPPEVVITLKEGETIVGVEERLNPMRFYISTDVEEEKPYE